MQQVLFTGRYQHDFAVLDASGRDSYHEWNVRRFRAGGRVTLFQNLLVHAEVDLNPQERDPFYVRFTDFYVQWTHNPQLSITAGKQGIPFTLDGATSSRELITIDRSIIGNNIWFPQEYLPGVSVSGRVAPWSYRVGVYSAGAMNREFGEFTGGAVGLLSASYDMARPLGAREALLTGNYVYQQPDIQNTFTRQLEHIGSAHFRFERQRWGLRGELSAGAGYFGQPDLWGAVAMPFVNATPKLQFVGRYSFLSSTPGGGVRLNTYENRLVSGRGDEYEEWYGGANYYFYGHRLKLQTGLQHVDMDDPVDTADVYSGLSFTAGVRVGW